ncbi:hypothetical protein [Bordetella sp. LUAb4]|uniref:hypothetical protein n=1 Tax=Bordetella sp. LUAb4 TaxID=2843195 RepID=UPI001E4450D5|nr:hypothetical protein [Bordetella sp. LUAb4]
MNFFEQACQQGPFTQTSFGICDDEDGGVAYVTLVTPPPWGATVSNPRQEAVTFTAIDKCVIKDHEEERRGRCDGMLTTAKHLYMLELKNQGSGWRQDAIEQLKSTLRFLQDSEADLSGFRYKKAFACNRRHRAFAVIDNEVKKGFFTEFGFRLDLQATIVIE